jgi:hypothetical protein
LRSDFRRESIIKVGYINITSISMLNYASSDVVISYQNNRLKLTLSDYIYHKNEKDKPMKMDLSLLKNDITAFFKP